MALSIRSSWRCDPQDFRRGIRGRVGFIAAALALGFAALTFGFAALGFAALAFGFAALAFAALGFAVLAFSALAFGFAALAFGFAALTPYIPTRRILVLTDAE